MRAPEGCRSPVSDAGEAVRLGLPAYIVLGEVFERRAGGVVRAGRDRRRGVDVVVKVAPPERREHIEAESRALARLGPHPHVVAVVAVGTATDGSAWLVTDRALGGTIAPGEVPDLRTALRWGAEVAAALHHAHSLGVVHGDVTPSNVFLDDAGRALLGDFGSAGLGDPGTAREAGHTPRLAAPERRRGGPATTASDVYGLGATVAACLAEVARAGSGGEAPPKVRALLERCTAPEPSVRPAAAEVADRLRRAARRAG